MEKKTNKTKLGELAKDLNVSNTEIVKCLESYDGETRKTQASLVPEEVSYVLEYFTQNNQVENFNAYFANNVRPEGEEKPEAKKPAKAEKNPAEKTEEKTEVKAEPEAAPAAEEKKPEPAPACRREERRAQAGEKVQEKR